MLTFVFHCMIVFLYNLQGDTFMKLFKITLIYLGITLFQPCHANELVIDF